MRNKERYSRLLSRVSGASVDFGRVAIYLFPKYCRHCNIGMRRPGMSDRRTVRKQFNKGFCSDVCFEAGPRPERTMRISESAPFSHRADMVEELAFLGMEISREEGLLRPILQLIHFAEREFQFLSEKMRFLEIKTGKKWYTSKYFFWRDKLYEFSTLP